MKRTRALHSSINNLLFVALLSIIPLAGCQEVTSSENNTQTQNKMEARPDFALVIHGGAGTILKKNMTDEKEQAYREKLTEALQTGYKILESGGTALDAIEKTINVMEDSPLFNAGKGAVFSHDGKNELDASIMNGATLAAGSVGGVSRVRNPIGAARAVMEKSQHVMMVEDGADAFAESQGLKMVDPEYFYTERRWKSLQRLLEKEESESTTQLDHDARELYSTVGAVALDRNGDLAAGTSTGGMTNKRFGRIGDSPIIGAGTYADNEGCAVSATGHGEYFIRNVVAYDINALVKYRDWTINKAAEYVVNDKLVKQEGSGGIIGIDHHGNIAMPFNTEGMYRGYILPDGEAKVLIYGDEQ